ncbi:DUF4393 domain-containing protein [Myroides marinus]|nr:DUF4393 domain-containing protein [Myroides marinus]
MEQNNKETNIKTTIDAVTGLVQAVPVYQDTLQPAAKEVGKSLAIVAKTVNIALAPVKAIVWGYEQIEEYVTNRVSEKLRNIPNKNITTPPLQVAGPTIEALRYVGHDPNLRELYANLLANAMDKDTIHKAHPGFVEILKNLSSDEANLLKAFVTSYRFPLIDLISTEKNSSYYRIITTNFSHLDHYVSIQNPDLIPSYLDNLIRLGILEIPSGVFIAIENIYDSLENDEKLNAEKEYINNVLDGIVSFERKQIRTTTFGQQFIQNVVTDK